MSAADISGIQDAELAALVFHRIGMLTVLLGDSHPSLSPDKADELLRPLYEAARRLQSAQATGGL